MILLGRHRSPFTRRVAISLRHLGIVYEHRPITAWTHLDELRGANPVGRVPALILDSGETLFDSHAILDYLDQLVGPERALVPPREPRRREVLRLVACAMGTLEKVVAALYERTMHPPEKVHRPWLVHNRDQARGGLAWLERNAGEGWLAGDDLTQADITAVAMLDFTRIVEPVLLDEGAYPQLEALVRRCNALPPFAQTRPTDEVDRADPRLPGS